VLYIRSSQIKTFREQLRRRFEERMVRHLHTYFPEQCAALGDEGTREAIGHGIDRAQAHGIVTERDVCRYLNVMFTFGRDFDSDPRCPWAARILDDTARPHPSERMDALYDEAIHRSPEAPPEPMERQEPQR